MLATRTQAWGSVESPTKTHYHMLQICNSLLESVSDRPCLIALTLLYDLNEKIRRERDID